MLRTRAFCPRHPAPERVATCVGVTGRTVVCEARMLRCLDASTGMREDLLRSRGVGLREPLLRLCMKCDAER